MFKNIFIATLLLLTSAHSVEISLNHNPFGPDSDDPSEKYNVSLSDYSPTNQDWLAIYKQGTSTDWKNVIIWTWADKLRGDAPEEDTQVHWREALRGLPIGQYEARFFRNNSYQTEASLAFTVEEEVNPLYIKAYHYSKVIRAYIIKTLNHKETEQDWVGLYKVGDSNDWVNVKKWAWANDLVYGDKWSFSSENLEVGKYEIRYFKNNSYTTYAKSTVLEIEEPIVPASIELGDIIKNVGENSANLNVSYKNVQPRSSKDWIALVKNDDNFYNSNNVVAWQYLDNMAENGSVTFVVHPNYWTGKKLKAIIYKNDGYTILSQGSRTY